MSIFLSTTEQKDMPRVSKKNTRATRALNGSARNIRAARRQPVELRARNRNSVQVGYSSLHWAFWHYSLSRSVFPLAWVQSKGESVGEGEFDYLGLRRSSRSRRRAHWAGTVRK